EERLRLRIAPECAHGIAAETRVLREQRGLVRGFVERADSLQRPQRVDRADRAVIREHERLQGSAVFNRPGRLQTARPCSLDAPPTPVFASKPARATLGVGLCWMMKFCQSAIHTAPSGPTSAWTGEVHSSVLAKIFMPSSAL